MIPYLQGIHLLNPSIYPTIISISAYITFSLVKTFYCISIYSSIYLIFQGWMPRDKRLPQPSDEPGVPVLDLDKLDVPVPLAGEEDHVGVRVKEGDQDARGHVEGEKVLRTRQLPGGGPQHHPSLPQEQFLTNRPLS